MSARSSDSGGGCNSSKRTRMSPVRTTSNHSDAKTTRMTMASIQPKRQPLSTCCPVVWGYARVVMAVFEAGVRVRLRRVRSRDAAVGDHVFGTIPRLHKCDGSLTRGAHGDQLAFRQALAKFLGQIELHPGPVEDVNRRPAASF